MLNASKPIGLGIPTPTPEDILAISANLGLKISPEDAVAYAEVVGTSLHNYNIVDGLLADHVTPSKIQREFMIPSVGENRNNA
ncbi:hypothetical protein NPS49_09710 [Pseudomonas putida]|uniref:hypothetical protein n=1 Tax=Pseudomonas putida TaxID=303 RepID=UPI0023641241|nr:hypothetical protein [Pseudomonas putida]MDD2068593.1 hypothetical protein [Pseudomonas putida]HDS1738528.1 hypothetical protein [Pseudomonas putida]